MKKPLTFIFLFILFLFATNVVGAITIANDTIYLYENGKRVTNNSWMVDHDRSSPSCKRGVCRVQQGDEPTFYKTTETYVLDYGEWIDNWYLSKPGCEEFATKKDGVSNALEEWRYSDEHKKVQEQVDKATTTDERKAIWEDAEPQRESFMTKKFDFYDNPDCKSINFSDYDTYLDSLTTNALYSNTVNIPPSKVNRDNYMLGTPRFLKIDVNDEKMTIIPLIFWPYYKLSSYRYLVPVMGILFITSLSYIILKRIRK